MLKIIRIVLYSLAIVSSVAGLFDGGIPLVKYALEQWHNHEYGSYYDRSYYDTSYLNSPKIIFLLSLILLVFVNISYLVGKGIHVAGPANPDSSRKPREDSPTTTNENSQPIKTVATVAQAEPESADEKLTRLLNQKKS